MRITENILKELIKEALEDSPKMAGDVAKASTRLEKTTGLESLLGQINTRSEFEGILLRFIRMVAKTKLSPQDVKAGVRAVAVKISKAK